MAMLLCLLGLPGCEPHVSDTGYAGTWTRGSARSQSTIAIHKDSDRYLFRWKVDTADGKWRVRCDWEGRCEEHVNGEKVGEYEFDTRVDPASGRLRVECTGNVTKPKPLAIHYVDELVLEPGGRVLWSYTLQRGGQTFEGEARPRRSFHKVSDDVGELPGRAAR